VYTLLFLRVCLTILESLVSVPFMLKFLSVYTSLNVSVCLYSRLSNWLSGYTLVLLSFCLSILLSSEVSVWFHFCLLKFLSVYILIYYSFCLSTILYFNVQCVFVFTPIFLTVCLTMLKSFKVSFCLNSCL